MQLEGYTFLQALGQGRNKSNSVMLMEDNKERQKYVVKRVDLTMLEAEPRRKTLQECELLIALRHPNIVKYRESVSTGKWQHTVMEFCEGGSLEEYVARRRKSGAGPFPETQVLRWMAQLCSALHYCHENNILHRDLKTATCFLSSDCSDLLLGDFGIAKVLPNSLAVAQTIIGSPCNMSPEVIQGRAYNTSSDLWSLGCLFYEVVALAKPFPAQSLHQLVQQVTVDSPPSPPSHCSRAIAKIISGLLVKNPDQRARLTDLLALPELQTALLPRNPSAPHTRDDRQEARNGGGAVPRGADIPMDKWLKGHYEKLSSIQKYIDSMRRADELHVRQQMARAKPKTPDISSARVGAGPAGQDKPKSAPVLGAAGRDVRKRRQGSARPTSPPALTQQQKEQIALEEKKRKILMEREEKKANARAAENRAREDRRNNAEQRRLAAEARRGHKIVQRPEGLKKNRDDQVPVQRGDRLGTPTSPMRVPAGRQSQPQSQPVSPQTPDHLNFSRGSDRLASSVKSVGSFGRAREGYTRAPKDDRRDKAAKRVDDKGDRGRRAAKFDGPASPSGGEDAREERREQRRQAQDNLRAKIMEDRKRAMQEKRNNAGGDMSVEICIPQHMR